MKRNLQKTTGQDAVLNGSAFRISDIFNSFRYRFDQISPITAHCSKRSSRWCHVTMNEPAILRFCTWRDMEVHDWRCGVKSKLGRKLQFGSLWVFLRYIESYNYIAHVFTLVHFKIAFYWKIQRMF